MKMKTYKNLWNVAKAIFKRKFIALNYVREEKIFQIKDSTLKTQSKRS